MYRRIEVPDGLTELARVQCGVLARRQVLAHGLSDDVIGRLVRDGYWRRCAEGVYTTTDDSWEQRAAAGVLIGGPGAVLGLDAAGYLQRLVSRPPRRIPVFVPAQRQVRRDDRWRFIRSARDGIGAPPRTPYARTVLDLAGQLKPDGVAAVLGRAVGQDTALPARILRELERTGRQPHRRLIAEILGEVADGAQSALEVRYVRQVERPHGLPRATRQGRPSDLFRADAWYREYRLIVELDGRVHHEGLAASLDMDRDNLHRLEGCLTLRFGWRHVAGRPCQTARQVAEALWAGGWRGELRQCVMCGGSTRRRVSSSGE